MKYAALAAFLALTPAALRSTVKSGSTTLQRSPCATASFTCTARAALLWCPTMAGFGVAAPRFRAADSRRM